MRALVTGANGFIGSHLCESLLAQGHMVRGLVRRTSDIRWIKGLTESGEARSQRPEAKGQSLELVYGDVRDGESLRQAAAGVDCVFHLGAAVRARDRRDFEQVNCAGTRLVAEACIAAGVKRFVFFSSAAAAGPAESPERPRHEDDEPAPISAYGRGKLGAELVLQELRDRLHSVILRLLVVYGPRDRDMAIMLRWVKRGLMPVFGGVYSAVYVSDAVQSAVLAAERPVASGSVYFISDGHIYDYADMARVAEKALGRKVLRLKIPIWLLHAAGWLSESLTREGSIFNRDKAREFAQPCWLCNIGRARAELGYEPRYDLDRGMTETIRWYEQMGWI